MKKSVHPPVKANRKRKLWRIPVVILALLVAFALAGFFLDAPSRQEAASLTIGEIDFSLLQDGTFRGSYQGTKGSLRDATVEIVVKDGDVTEIRVLSGAVDENGTLQELAEGKSVRDLFDAVLQHESLHVDAISGATLTCNAHLKALENALLQAQQLPNNEITKEL